MSREQDRGGAGAVRGRPGARVVIVNPPALEGRTNDRTLSGGIGVSRKLKPWERAEGRTLPPIDLLYIAAVVERSGARAEILDLLLERHQGPAAERFCLERVGPDREGTWIGVRLSIPSLDQDLVFAERLKALLPRCRVFVFGAVVMSTLDHWIEGRTFDYVLYGEPEAFIDRVVAAEEPLALPGVLSPRTYRPLRGDDLFQPERNLERHQHWIRADVTKLPWPAWHLLDMDRYAGPGRRRAEVDVAIQASRGCPIGCNMCPYTLLEGQPWRSNGIERVVDEVEHLNGLYDITHVRFRDANFGFSRRYARELAEALIRRGVRLEAAVETSLEVLDEETLRRLQEAGVRTLTTGVETDDPACMASIGQPIKVNDRLRAGVALCHRLGLHVYGTYCLGMPEETWDTVERTWRFARELDIESGFTVLTPFPGTPLFYRAVAEGLLPRTMQFAAWNSYQATVRSYALTTRDLDMARWWARMETIIPYRRKRLGSERALDVLGFHLRHLPHHAWRQVCRAYVWIRRRFPGPAVEPPAARGVKKLLAKRSQEAQAGVGAS